MPLKKKSQVDEEFQSLQLDKPGVGKTPSQIQMHTIEEQYENKPIERSLYILTKGDELQKLSVIQNLPNLLQADYNATISRIIPKIQQELPVNSSIEFQLVTSKMFKILIDMDLDLNLLRAILQGIESKDPMVASTWNETLLEVISHLQENFVKTQVFQFAVKQSELSRPIFYRVNSCKMLGQIAIHPKMTPFDVKRDVVPVTQSLCQDCLYDVRAAMCEELPHVAKGLANDADVDGCLLPCLVELSNDENMNVRAAAVNAAVLLIPYLNSESIKQTSVPTLQHLCQHCFNEGDETYPHVAQYYGKMLSNLQQHLTDADAVWFLKQYNELSKRGLLTSQPDLESESPLGVICREYCANNIPQVALFVCTRIPHEIENWYTTFKDLANDPCFIVRKTIAGNIHQTTHVLGKESKIIFPDLLKIIRDDSEEVLDILVPNLGETLMTLSKVGCLSVEKVTPGTLDLGRALLKCHTEVFKYYSWRRKTKFLQQLEKLPFCMPSEFIHQHFTPLILKLVVEERARPVRTQAAKTVLWVLRYNMKENHRKWIRESLISSLCNSSCSYTRHIYITMCKEAMQIFSSKYFKEHFYVPLLALGEDPVTTVRLCFVNVCPLLKQMLVMPMDGNLVQMLDKLLLTLETDTDREVVKTLKSKDMRAVTKHEMLLEEKRRIEEEERVCQGKIVLPPLSAVTETGPTVKESASKFVQPNLRPRKSSSSSVRSTSSSEMSFFDQHFYIDAGVALPESASNSSVKTLDDEMSLLNLEHTEEIVPTVSVENTNIENMSDDDLIELKTSTTNITDDVKVDIEKKTCASKLRIHEVVKKRNKRNSCLFISDIAPKDSKPQLKRRSLNIAMGELSRIPVITKSLPTKKNKMGPESGSSKLKKIILTTENSDNIVKNKVCTKDVNKKTSLVDYKVKETVLINSKVKDKCNKDISIIKTSNLPILIRK